MYIVHTYIHIQKQKQRTRQANYVNRGHIDNMHNTFDKKNDSLYVAAAVFHREQQTVRDSVFTNAVSLTTAVRRTTLPPPHEPDANAVNNTAEAVLAPKRRTLWRALGQSAWKAVPALQNDTNFDTNLEALAFNFSLVTLRFLAIVRVCSCVPAKHQLYELQCILFQLKRENV